MCIIGGKSRIARIRKGRSLQTHIETQGIARSRKETARKLGKAPPTRNVY